MRRNIITIIFVLMFFLIPTAVYGAPTGSFTYTVHGQTVVVNPSLSDVTFYKWQLKGDYSSETEWIPIADVDVHRFILNWDTSYRITLLYKKGSDTGSFNQMVKVGNDPDPPDNDTVTPTVQTTSQFRNLYDQVPVWLKNRTVPELSIIGVLVIALFLFLMQKRGKKILLVPIDRKYGNRRKKINDRK